MIGISSRLAVKHLTTLLMLGVLAGCSERVVERQGADITLVPVTQTLTLSVPGRSLEGAEKEIEQFIQQNFASIEPKASRWHGADRRARNCSPMQKSMRRNLDSVLTRLLSSKRSYLKAKAFVLC